MSEDFEEDYEEEQSSIVDDIKEAKDKYDDLKDKYDQLKDKYNNKSQDISNQTKEAKEFNKGMQDKNMARANQPSQAVDNAQKVADATKKTQDVKKAADAAKKANDAKKAADAAKKANDAKKAADAAKAAKNAAQVAKTAKVAKDAGTIAAAGGAVAAQAAIPVAGWIALIIEAVISLVVMLHKLKKKHDKKMAENGIDSKGIRRLMIVAPIMFPIAVIILVFIIIIILFMDAEATDKVEFMSSFEECYTSYSQASCQDFMNTGIHVNPYGIYSGPMIKKTDIQIGNMVVKYLRVYNKRFKKDDSFITDLVDEINDPGALSLDEASQKGPIEALFTEFFDEIGATVEEKTHGIRLAWSLFNWMRMEKKIYQGIVWKKVFNATPMAFATEGLAKLGALFTGKPAFIDGSGFTIEPIQLDFNPGNAWLPTPLNLSLDEAIEIAREYIPSWMEIYTTYVITEDFDFANDLYHYYIAKDISGNLKNIPIEISLYQLITLTRTHYVENGRTISYSMTKGDSATQELSESEYEAAIQEGSQTFWSWLGDSLSNVVSEVGAALDTAKEKIKEWIGWHIETDTRYSALVTMGYGYTYSIYQKANIDLKEDSWTESGAESKQKKSNVVTKKIGEENVKFASTISVVIDHHVEQWENIVKITNSTVKKYINRTRYLDVASKVIQNKDYSYTLDDISIAGDLIDNHYATKYNMKTSFAHADPAESQSEINGIAILIAKQFEGKDLSYMEGIDDTGIFWSADWCAMFVSYCMNKVGLDVINFTGCTTFKNTYNQKVGFYDDPSSAQLKSIVPGDIILFRYPGEPSNVRNHTAIVLEVIKDDSGNVEKIKTIDGNITVNFADTGYWKSIVKVCERTSDQIGSYISISEVKKSVDDYGYWRDR